MKKLFLMVFVISSFSLSSCAFEQMDKGLAALNGHNIKTAINYLGYPDGQQEIAGDKVYTWGKSFTQTTVMPVTNYSSGNVFGRGGSAMYSGYTTSYVPQVNTYSCVLKIITNKKDIIIHGQYEGNLGGCENYGSRLNRAAKEIAPTATISNQNEGVIAKGLAVKNDDKEKALTVKR